MGLCDRKEGMRALLFLLSFFLAAPAEAADCRDSWDASLQLLKKSSTDSDLRSREAKCLLRFHLDKPEVTSAALKILKDGKEDVLLREDLMEAFASSPLRKSIKVEGTQAPELDKQDQLALDRTVASAQNLVNLTQAMKTMNEVVYVTRHEQEFFRAMSELALDDTNPVILRETAVSSLEAASKKVYESGLFDERGIRQVQEALNTVANRDDTSSYYTGAAKAYGRLASSGLPSYVSAKPGRALASDKSKK